MIERISKLLALAEGAATPEEAEVAFAKAQELASKHAIDLELARRVKDKKVREVPEERRVSVGVKGKRSNKPLIELYSTIAKHNDVTLLIAHDSTLIYGYGMPSDLDNVELMWNSLALTMQRFADKLIRDRNAPWRSEMTERYNRYSYSYERVPVSAHAARRSFCDGFMSRIGERLRESREAAVEHFHAEEQVPVAALAAGGPDRAPSSMALVLKEKRDEVEEFMWAKYERDYGRRRPRGSWRSGSYSHSQSSFGAGREAGSSASMGTAKGIGR